MKIKRKVQKNLPQLIEWGFNNPKLAKGSIYKADESFVFSSYVSFPGDGTGVRIPCTITKDDTFTIEVEEEVTEDTVMPEMLTIYDKGITHLTNNKSLNGLIKTNLKSAYILNDDLTLTLIWKEGRLIDWAMETNKKL